MMIRFVANLGLIFAITLPAITIADPLVGGLHSIGRKTVFSGECHISIYDKYGGNLNDNSRKDDSSDLNTFNEAYATYYKETSARRGSNDISLSFKCEKISLEQACKKFANLEYARNKWKPVDLPHDVDRHTRLSSNPIVVTLDRGGTRGALYVSTDTSGAMQYRHRYLGYCLSAHNGVSIFGGGIVNYPPFNPSSSTEKEVIELLKSVKFEQ
ncbi:hypothetical protein V4C53_17005 [Paraburkholderia azotifigens]|uniref:hypothetical protein n=1 Tax=Paraburkholderia azotifigens TaxID=2057004 RepID=UPI003180EB97